VLTEVTGVSSRRILAALIEGERDPRHLADLAVRTARRKIPELALALDGTFTAHHARMCAHFPAQIDHLAGLIAQLDGWIGELLGAQDKNRDGCGSARVVSSG